MSYSIWKARQSGRNEYIKVFSVYTLFAFASLLERVKNRSNPKSNKFYTNWIASAELQYFLLAMTVENKFANLNNNVAVANCMQLQKDAIRNSTQGGKTALLLRNVNGCKVDCFASFHSLAMTMHYFVWGKNPCYQI